MGEASRASSRVLSTVAPFGFNFDPDRFLLAYKRIGCTSAQFYYNRDNKPSVKQVLDTFRRVGMNIDSTHGIFGSDIDPSSPDPAHREHCLRLYEHEGQLAKDLGGPIVVVHPAAHLPTTPDAPYEFPKIPPDEARKAQSARTPHLIDFLRRLADLGDKLGVVFVVENMGFVVPIGHDAPLLGSMIATIGSRYIRMCFDTGHAHFSGDVYAALKQCAPVIGYVHMHDNDRQTDNHLMPGDGTIDWARIASLLDELDIAVPRMLEVFEPEAATERRADEGKLAKLLAPLVS
ncbi:MAG: sugar phosphate isomerase/epimerase [Phycisphaerales bacterium]|nr:sugar phosphate isomerase/epimerase [Phycisphaerales bacterium]